MPGFLPLDGVRVADFTQASSGHHCAMLLADLGAAVAEHEMPGRGDDSRQWGAPFVGDTTAYFLAVTQSLGLGGAPPTPEDARSTSDQDDVADAAAAERELP